MHFGRLAKRPKALKKSATGRVTRLALGPLARRPPAYEFARLGRHARCPEIHDDGWGGLTSPKRTK